MLRRIIFREGYKYQLGDTYEHPLPDEFVHARPVEYPFYAIRPDGPNRKLVVKAGYAWDGPSGPTIDSLTFIRGSLVHDVLYQILREKVIPHIVRCPGYDFDVRKWADEELARICREDGMSRFRARYVLWAVRTFGAESSVTGRPWKQAP